MEIQKKVNITLTLDEDDAEQLYHLVNCGIANTVQQYCKNNEIDEDNILMFQNRLYDQLKHIMEV